ncbi:MAG TPA: LCP family protein [Solirubrobacterales bacterium]
MIDRDRDEFYEDPDDEAHEPPPPATWAGRRAQGHDEDADLGLTEEFDSAGDELDAGLEDEAHEDEAYEEEAYEEEPYAEGQDLIEWEDEGAPEWEGDAAEWEDDGEAGWDDLGADELEVPPDEFEFEEDEVEYEGELEVTDEFATAEHEAAVGAKEPAEPQAAAEEAPPPVGQPTEEHDALAAGDGTDAEAAGGAAAEAPSAEVAEEAPAAADGDADPKPEGGADGAEGERDGASAPEPAGAGAAAGGAGAAVAEVSAQETIEADTLALADQEEAREKAHAALKARAAERSRAQAETAAPATAPPTPAEPPAPEPPADPLPEELAKPPKRRLWLRFVAASFVVIAAMATATSVSLLFYLKDIASALEDNSETLGNVEASLQAAGGGEPQNILILGSDSREDPEQRKKNKGIQDARSDTTMLLRIDPDNDAIRLLSIPRDLKTKIPGLGTDKLNAAYSYGGPELTLKTVQRLFPDIEINHIVNVDFEGFYDAVNAIGCVYVDVDRHYYNPVGGEYDDIDIEAGYNKLCGYRALDYVRYRHNDNDLVRGTRQQDFLREARQRIPPSKLISDRNELIGIFTRYTTSDIDDPITLLEVLKTLVAARNANVRQIEFQGSVGEVYVETTPQQIESMTEQFLADSPDGGEDGGGRGGESSGQKRGKPKKDKDQQKDKEQAAPQAPDMWDATGLSVPFAQQFDRYMRKKKADFDVYYPTVMVPGSTITDHSRAYGVPDFDDQHIYRGYKFVMTYQDAGFTSYYGVTGVSWRDPPILNNPSETRRIDGREYLLFYDGDRLRLVAWKTKQGSYWVINTLTRALSEEQMLAIATSAEKL